MAKHETVRQAFSAALALNDRSYYKPIWTFYFFTFGQLIPDQPKRRFVEFCFNYLPQGMLTLDEKLELGRAIRSLTDQTADWDWILLLHNSFAKKSHGEMKNCPEFHFAMAALDADANRAVSRCIAALRNCQGYKPFEPELLRAVADLAAPFLNGQ